MNFNFPQPSSSITSKSIPEQFIELANQLLDREIALPTVDRVLEAIKQNKAHEVTKLEWIYCIHAKEKWDEENSHISRETSGLIWKVAIDNEWLRHQLLWRLALYYGNNQNELAKSLAKTCEILINSPSVNHLLIVKIIQAVISNDCILKLAKIACEQNLTRKELLNKIQNELPIWIPQFDKFTEYISPYFCIITSPNQQQVNWLLRCFDQMSEEIQVKAINHLLVNVSKEVASSHPQLVEWVRNNYRNNQKWNRLSEKAKEKLREWIGAVNYADFQHLVNLILPNISVEKEQRQLKARQGFWENYSNSLQQLRILLPQNSYNVIKNKLRENIQIDKLQEDGSETTEVCIFDFGEWLVAEFFRGKGSETRLFTNNDKNKEMLFYKPELSVKRIRALGGEVHDHVLCWQWNCEKSLRQRQNKISPNEGTQYFIGLRQQYGKYDFHSGLPNPSLSKQQERESQFNNWRKTISQLEKEAKDYCNSNGFTLG